MFSYRRFWVRAIFLVHRCILLTILLSVDCSNTAPLTYVQKWIRDALNSNETFDGLTGDAEIKRAAKAALNFAQKDVIAERDIRLVYQGLIDLNENHEEFRLNPLEARNMFLRHIAYNANLKVPQEYVAFHKKRVNLDGRIEIELDPYFETTLNSLQNEP